MRGRREDGKIKDWKKNVIRKMEIIHCLLCIAVEKANYAHE